MTNYIEFATKIKEKYPEYKDIDDLVLAQKMVEKYPQYKETITFEEVKPEKKGIDLTPSGLANKIGQSAGAALASPIVAKRDNIPLKQAFEEGMERAEKARREDKLAGIQDFITDMAGYSAIPVLRGGGLANFAGNAALQGGVPAALESLKRGGSVAGGAGAGAGIAALLQTIPHVGKVIGGVGNKAFELSGKVGQIKPETLRQVIKPESKALEMSSEDAENLLLNLTKDIRKNYDSLLKKRGEAVNESIKNLGKNTQRFDAQDLINDVTSTFDQYQKDLINPARNMAGGLEDELINLINSGKPVNEIRELLKKIDKENLLQGKANLTNISDELINKAKEQGYDLSDYIHNIDSSAIRHIRKNHGSNSEYLRGQEPVNNNDFEALPRIIDSPDSIEFVGKNKLGRDVIKLSKDMKDNIANYFEEIREGQKTLSGDTLYKQLKGGRTAANAAFPTSKTIPTSNIITDNEAYFNSLSPLSLQGIKEQVGKMAKWGDEVSRGYAEPITEQIYKKFNDKLSSLSPELAEANKNFANLAAFKKNDGIKQILKGNLLSEGGIGTAPRALKSYKSSIDKANVGQNLQDLEKVLVGEGYEPFLNQIDDINAAMDLLKTETTGFGGVAGLAKSLLTRPILSAVRGANRAQLPEKMQALQEMLAPIGKLMPALGAKGASNMLYGGVSYDNYK